MVEYTKKCANFKKCGMKCGDGYDYCQKCNASFGVDNAIVEISKTLKQMNWNLGLRNEFAKRTNPKLWDEIEKEWKDKAKKNEEDEEDN